VPDSQVHPNRAHASLGGGQATSDLAREGDIPATGRLSDGGRQDAAGTVLKVAGELARRLVGLDDPDPRELNVLSVRKHSDCPGGESAAIPMAPALEARKADRPALAAPVPGGGEIPQRPRQAVQPRRIGFFAVVRPPRGRLLFGAIPLTPQGRQRPWDLNILTGRALIKAPFHEFKAPVVGEPGPTDR
jgi:hypothetical protein